MSEINIKNNNLDISTQRTDCKHNLQYYYKK